MEFTLEVRTYRWYLRDQANLPIASSTVRVRTSSNDLHLMNSNCLHDHTLSPIPPIYSDTHSWAHTHALVHSHTHTHSHSRPQAWALTHAHMPTPTCHQQPHGLPTPATIGISLCGLDSSASPETALGSQTRLRPVRDLYPANRTPVVFASLRHTSVFVVSISLVLSMSSRPLPARSLPIILHPSTPPSLNPWKLLWPFLMPFYLDVGH